MTDWLEELRRLIANAYATGATETHNAWVNGTNGGEPDFGEAASDYAAAQGDKLAANKAGDFQPGVHEWMLACFGEAIAADKVERADRFIEEALELVQTMPGFSADRAHALVDYVFAGPVGEPKQEVGGVMVTLAALCNTVGINIDECARTELARVWTKVEAIRAKQAAKPTGSALPIAEPQPDRVKALEAEVERLREALLATVNATRAYLPPDGIDEQECINRILAATDNPEINPYILATEARAALGGEDAAD